MKTLTITMKANDVAEVLLYDSIGEDPWFGGGISSKTFRDQVKAVKAATLNLRINSPGGSVFEGAAMLAALDAFPGRVEVDVDGLAASAASVLAMGGDEVRMASNAMMMIHEPVSGVLGRASDMRAEADLLDKISGQILDAYMRRAKMPRDRLMELLAAETWFTGAEATAAGLADKVTSALPVAACSIPPQFKYRNAPVPQPRSAPTPEQIAAHASRRAELARLLAK